MIVDNETNFPHELLLTNRQVANLRKAFANYLSTDIKLSKTQLSKLIQSGEFLGRLLGPLRKTGLFYLFFYLFQFFNQHQPNAKKNNYKLTTTLYKLN